MIVVATVGAAYSANKGAASMLQALFDRLPAALGACRFEILSTHPASDLADLPTGADVRVRSSRPAEMVAMMLPLAVLAGTLRILRLPYRSVLVHSALRALHASDVVVDVTGISYASGRGIPRLVYNVLNTLIPRLLGRPVVMGSQALGPFDEPLVRIAARSLLPGVATICARGRSTREHLDGLGLANVVAAADLAFLMDVGEGDRDAARAVLDESGVGDRFMVVAPSAVVDGYARKAGLDYVGTTAALVDEMAKQTGLPIVVLPHSTRPDMERGTLNDRPVCRDVASRAGARDACVVVDRSLPPAVLRAIIEQSEFLLTSRFHAMISALAVATPLLVVGWSHKYAEVLDDFGLGDQVMPFEGVSIEGLVDAWRRSYACRDAIAAAASAGSPAAAQSAGRCIAAITSAVGADR